MDYCSNTPRSPSLNHELVQLNQIIMEALETKAQVTSYNRNLFVNEKWGKEGNHMGTKLLAGIFHLLRTARCSTSLNGSDLEQIDHKGS